ncbi:hypothetical protein ACWFQ8_04745 [Streptomyces sp. NPDC055254]
MSGAKKTATAVLALVGTLLLGACGIKPTGVIDSGHAATVVVPGAADGPVLYYVNKETGRLVPAPLALEGYTIKPPALLSVLLTGRGAPARAAGLTTELPQVPAQEAMSTEIEHTAEGRVRARVPFKVGDLSELGVGQIVCTLGFAVTPGTLSEVTVQGTDTVLEPAMCDLRR